MLQKRGFEIINLTLSNTTKLILLDSFLQEVTAINPYLSKADPAYKVLVSRLREGFKKKKKIVENSI